MKNRLVNTRFWDDDYSSNLDPIEKLLFLYFLTNPSTNIAGIYEIPLKKVAVETGIEKETVERILSRFERDNKILYRNGWIAIKNFIKHQTLNPKVKKGIEVSLENAPAELRKFVEIKSIDRLSHPNSNSNLNSNSNSKDAGDKSPILPFFEDSKNKTEEYRAHIQKIASGDYLKPAEIHRIIQEEFVPYWTESSTGGKKQRWQKEKVFDPWRRVATWLKYYHERKKDYKCKQGIWHAFGNRCSCGQQEGGSSAVKVPETPKPMDPENTAKVEEMRKDITKRFGIKSNFEVGEPA